VLYHGIVTPGRGLEVAIDSVADWRPEFDLTIRGPGGSDYLDALRRRIAERGLSSRIILVPPVPMTELVREAAAYDVGFFALPGSSRHNEFALPNKFFEYVMAGLALCLTDLPEMARLVRAYRLGVTFRSVDPQSIAGAINALDPASIDRYKRNALEAACELCWEREAERLVSAYGALLGSAMPQAA
jgi:glycosyltransferase involved in cell wall biosynthesis